MDRILVTETIAEEGIAALRTAAEVDIHTNLDKAQLIELLPNYDALIVRSATKVTADVLAAGERLRVVGRAGTGVDNIDVNAATERGILVVNAPAANSVAAAELTITFIMALARRLPDANTSLKSGKWERSKFMGFEVRGKTIGLIGLGRIGTEVARRARGLEMNVLAYDPVVSTDRAEQLGITLASMDDVLTQSDFLSVHVPLIDSTRHMINAARLAQMKPTAYLINAARGGIVDENALLEAIEKGVIAGAALDVFEQEPSVPPELAANRRLVLTPHIGGAAAETHERMGANVLRILLEHFGAPAPRG